MPLNDRISVEYKPVDFVKRMFKNDKNSQINCRVGSGQQDIAKMY